VGFFKRFKKPKASVSLKILENTIALGDDFRTQITINAKEEFDATEVRLELNCIEKQKKERWVYNKRLGRNIRQVYWDNTTLHSDHIKAYDQLHLVPGFRKTFDTSVNIPLASKESYDGSTSNVKWMIKGVIAVDDRPDVTGKIHELQIYRASIQAKPQNQVKKVACIYCDTLMDDTLSECPNCGAPRKK
jgi:hypothetical protein